MSTNCLASCKGPPIEMLSCFNIFDHNIWIFLITNIWIFKICFPCLHKEALTHKIVLHEWIICQQPHREEHFNAMVNVSFHKVKIHRPSNSLFFSRPRTRCTSTVRSGTSYLAQRRTKTQPTSDSTTPRKISWLLREIAFFYHYGDRLVYALAPISCPSSPPPKIPHSFLFS